VKSEWIVWAFKRLWRVQSDDGGESDGVDPRNKAEMRCRRLRWGYVSDDEERNVVMRVE
jgi:hypothetical protein